MNDDIVCDPVVGFDIYRSTVEGGPYDFIKRVVASSYSDIELDSDQTYFYVLEAVDGLDAVMCTSNEDSDTTLPEGCGATLVADTTDGEAPLDVEFTATPPDGWGPVTYTWFFDYLGCSGDLMTDRK